MEGYLQDSKFVSTLRSIGRQRKTGILTIQGPEEIIAFSFSAGGIVGADALNQSLEDGLGEVLSAQQLVDPSEFAALAAEHEAGGGRVVDLLVERSFLSRGQLLTALRNHTYRLCLQALSWRSGEYRFYQGDEVAFEQGIEPIGVAELLVRSSEDLGAAGPLPTPAPRLDDVYSRSGESLDATDDEQTDSAALEPARRILDLIDGKRTLAEVAASSDLGPFEVLDLTSEWQERGLVEIRGSEAAEGEGVLPVPSVDLPQTDRAAEIPKYEETPSSADLGSQPGSSTESPRAPRRAPKVGRRRPRPSPKIGWEETTVWVSRLCGLMVLVATVTLMVLGPSRVLLPFPWQGSLREGLRGNQRTAQRLKIEHGAATFFLLVGRYPETLDELEERGLVNRRDLVTPEGALWKITANPASFVLSARWAGQEELEETSWTSSIASNFLLDPEFVRPAATTEEPLLVLLD